MAQFLANGLVAGFGYALVALALQIAYLPSRFLNFSLGGMLAAGAYFTYFANARLFLPIFVSILIGVLLVASLGLLIDVVFFKPLRRHQANSGVLLICSLGVYICIQNGISICFGDDFKSFHDERATESLNLAGVRLTSVQLMICAVSVASFIGMWFLFRYSRFGRHIKAVADDPTLAVVCGVKVNYVMCVASGIASMFAGIAGICMAFDVDMAPTMGLNPMMAGAVAMIVGGEKRLWSTLLGGLCLGVLQHLVVWKIGSLWQNAIVFAVLVVFLTLKNSVLFAKAKTL